MWEREPDIGLRRKFQQARSLRFRLWATAVFIRFIIQRLDSDSGRRQGLFQAAVGLRASGDLTLRDHQRLKAILSWFDANLDKPVRLAVSSRRHAKAQAICWFKVTANAHISRMRELQRLLESYGLAVETIRACRPGYILYEDEFQVAAYPFRDTPT